MLEKYSFGMVRLKPDLHQLLHPLHHTNYMFEAKRRQEIFIFYAGGHLKERQGQRPGTVRENNDVLAWNMKSTVLSEPHKLILTTFLGDFRLSRCNKKRWPQ
jgi:hypothetical protein